MRTIMLLAVLGCGDFSSPSSLEHAQIVAVRASPPRMMPNERARIDVLASLDDGTVLELEAQEVMAPPIEIRGEPVPIPVEVSVDLNGTIKRAEKLVYLGEAGANPAIDAIAVDDAPVEDLTGCEDPASGGPGESGEPVVVAVGSRPKFTVAATGEGELAYAWYSSVGDLGFYRSQTMELHADAADDGVVIAVVRDALGGTEWRRVEVSVR